MAQIKCPNCNSKINEKSIYCSQCGTKIEQDKEELISIKIKKEKTNILTYIIYIGLFIGMLAIISSNLVFLKTLRTELTLQQVQFSPTYEGFISLFPSIIINITFIACILNILTKKYFIITKILYIINIITCFILFVYIYSNGYRIGTCYYLLILMNNILLLLPRFGSIKETEIEVEEKDISKEEKKTTKLEELYTPNKFNNKKFFIIVLFFTIELVSTIIIAYFNNKDIYKETIIQANSEFQIRVINDYINIRKSQSTESEILGEVMKDDIYNVLDVYGGDNYIWYKIDYKGKIGYIASDRNNPYIEELYSNTLVVNVFCTDNQESCAYLMDSLSDLKKNKNYYFLINYLDLEDNHSKQTYYKTIKYFGDRRTTPYIVIGNTSILGFNDDTIKTIKETIDIEKETNNNIVDDIKKGNKPKKEKEE